MTPRPGADQVVAPLLEGEAMLVTYAQRTIRRHQSASCELAAGPRSPLAPIAALASRAIAIVLDHVQSQSIAPHELQTDRSAVSRPPAYVRVCLASFAPHRHCWTIVCSSTRISSGRGLEGAAAAIGL